MRRREEVDAFAARFHQKKASSVGDTFHSHQDRPALRRQSQPICSTFARTTWRSFEEL